MQMHGLNYLLYKLKQAEPFTYSWQAVWDKPIAHCAMRSNALFGRVNGQGKLGAKWCHDAHTQKPLSGLDATDVPMV